MPQTYPRVKYINWRKAPRDLKKYRRGLVSSRKFIRDRNTARAKEQPVEASERRAVKEDELHAELEQQGQRHGRARRRPSHLQQLAGQRRAQLQQRVADLALHLAQRQLKNLR